jgi:hypothetical protein
MSSEFTALLAAVLIAELPADRQHAASMLIAHSRSMLRSMLHLHLHLHLHLRLRLRLRLQLREKKVQARQTIMENHRPPAAAYRPTPTKRFTKIGKIGIGLNGQVNGSTP